MKNLILVVGMLTGFSGIAKAEFYPKPLESSLTQFNIDKKLYNGAKFGGGAIELNTAMKTITLTLAYASHCIPGRLCAEFIIAPVVITLPIESVEIDTCGSKIYHASKDLRREDGILQTLDVTDNSENDCETLVALAPVAARYETDGMSRAGQIKTSSSFEGTAFQIQ